jgi:hypothetical protein
MSAGTFRPASTVLPGTRSWRATQPAPTDELDGLLDALRSLKTAGCSTAYLDGSFVTAKANPADFVVPIRLDSELQEFSNDRTAQKARYGGEIFPAQWPAHPDGTTFLDYFQYDNVTEGPKGIIAIDLAGLP